MARSDLLAQLFARYARGDDAGFRRIAVEIIAEERRKRHGLLAATLERELSSDLRPGATAPLTLRPIPKARDDRPLLRLSKPERTFDELVLGPETLGVLRDVVRENRQRPMLASHGLRPRQRLVFLGPSGTGKSASAHAIADELSLPVATASLAALTSSYLGDTARNVEAVIRFAEQTPCVLLLDEFDVLGQERAQAGDHGEMRRVAATVLQLLEDQHGESVVVATSNHPQAVDVALWRRFDEVVVFDLLGPAQLADLVDLKLRAMPSHVSPRRWARRLSGFAPAEVELVCYDAMRRALMAHAGVVEEDDLAQAVKQMRARRRAVSRLATDAPAPCN